MSLSSYTIPADFLRKSGDLDLHPVRLRSPIGSCSLNPHAAPRYYPSHRRRQGYRCGDLRGAVHPLSLIHAEGGHRGNRRPRCAQRMGILRPIPFHGCLRGAPSLPDFPMSHSVTRSVLIPRPAARRGSASHSVRPSGFGFQKIFSVSLRTERGRKDFPNLPKKRHLALGSGAHSRRFAQECPE